MLTWNIFDGMTSIAKSKESIEQKYQAEKTLRQAELKAQRDFDYWKRKYVYFCSVYEARKNDIVKAEESVRLSREGQKVGARTNTDVLDAEAELFRARAGAVNAQIGAIEAIVNLELSSGEKLVQFN
jgi:outer membrane protein TolC